MADSDATHFTTIVRWQGFKEVTFNGVSYGQRNAEFPKLQDLPRRTQQAFRIAQMGVDPKTLETHGWDVVPGEIISKTPQSYREFIQQSRGELGIPKQGYVAMRGGWISDRSVCYLASGRPVVIRDTGAEIGSGEGFQTFADLDSAVAAIENVNRDYKKQRLAARRLAEDTFATDKVLPRFLADVFN